MSRTTLSPSDEAGRPLVSAIRRSPAGSDVYVLALALVLAGYLFFGRPFAYVHVPATPLFLGEIVLGAGLVLVLRRGVVALDIVRRSAPLEALLLLLTLGTARLIYDLPAYGLLAVRDAALWYYGALAFAVAALLQVRPELLDRLERWYARVLPWFLVWAGVAVIISRRFAGEGPMMPGTDVALLGFKAGDLGVHAAIGVAFLWLCRESPTLRSRRLRLVATATGLSSVLIAGTTNRGGLVSAAIILGGTALAAPRRRSFAATILGIALVLVALVAITDVRIEVAGRQVSLEQLTENVASITGGGGSPEGAQAGTVRWRVSYWGEIGRDTVAGRNGALGLGFGTNLADHYGYQVAFDTEQQLRNAHNSHMTLLARLGVPGLALWLLLWVVWSKTLFDAGSRAAPGSRQRRLSGWVGLSVLGILINAVFDPTLEGPQMALWLWSLVGLGCALPLIPGSPDQPFSPAPGGRPLATAGQRP